MSTSTTTTQTSSKQFFVDGRTPFTMMSLMTMSSHLPQPLQRKPMVTREKRSISSALLVNLPNAKVMIAFRRHTFEKRKKRSKRIVSSRSFGVSAPKRNYVSMRQQRSLPKLMMELPEVRPGIVFINSSLSRSMPTSIIRRRMSTK